MYLAPRRAPARRSPPARRRRSRRRRAFIRGDGAGAARGPRGQAPRTGARTRRADGYDYTIVNGVITFEGLRCTGATPGRLLRAGRAQDMK